MAHGVVSHFNLVSDPGTHDYKECLVSLLWCWEITQGMHCPWQFLVPGKILTPLDIHMDEAMARYAARQKLERVASFRQLQGYSNQLRVMTRYLNPPVTLISFKLPAGFHIRSVSASEGRKTVRGAHQDVSYIVNKVTKVRTAVLPPAPIKVRLLVVQLDQGSIGCGGAAFVIFFLHMIVLAKFDKIHRLIRDLKGSENGCCRKIFTKTKLWSAYLYSLSKRPFGTGQNATLKQRWIEVFEVQCDIHSAVFRKYLPKIGKAWNMPYGTVTEKQAVFDAVLEMDGFRAHGSHPKLANWFAWNKSANEQMPEFHAGKMVMESQLIGETDPVA